MGGFPGGDDEVRQSGTVDRTARARAEDDTDLGHQSGGRAGTVEDAPVLAQRSHALLDLGATGVDQADHGDAQTQSVVEQTDDLVALDRAKRSAGNGEVLGVDGHLASVYLTEPGDDARGPGPRSGAGARVAADLEEGAGIQQPFNALASGLLAFGVLTRDGAVLSIGVDPCDVLAEGRCGLRVRNSTGL